MILFDKFNIIYATNYFKSYPENYKRIEFRICLFLRNYNVLNIVGVTFFKLE